MIFPIHIPGGLALAAVLCICFASGCTQNDGRTAERRDQDTAAPVAPIDTVEAAEEQIPAIRYRRVPVPGRKGLDSLRELVGEEHLMTVLRINRKDTRHIARNDTLVVPDTLLDIMAYSPFPYRLQSAEEIRKLIFVDQRIQAVAAYENGRLVLWTPTSTGKKSTPTDTGLFHTNWRSRKRASTINSDWIMEWYWNLENRSGVSMHQYDLPGYPASHACIRLLKEDAQWFYEWCEAWRLRDGRVAVQGTPVIIYRTYQFGESAPWKSLPESPDAVRVTADELGAVLAQYLPAILREEQQRDSLTAAAQSSRQATDSLPKAPLP